MSGLTSLQEVVQAECYRIQTLLTHIIFHQLSPPASDTPIQLTSTSHKVIQQVVLKANGHATFQDQNCNFFWFAFLPAGHARSARPAGPKITFHFLVLCMYLCASALTTCTIITSHTLLPCDLTLVDFALCSNYELRKLWSSA